MIGIFLNGERIGTVAKFVGNKPSERWVGWALRTDPTKDLRAAFPTKKAAVAWVRNSAAKRMGFKLP